MKYNIFGMYWVNTLTPDNLPSAHKYIGTVEMKEDGTFFGTLYDDFGPAEVVGKRHDAGMSWTKKYDLSESPNGAKFPIQYNFGGVGYGWFGNIEFDKKEQADSNLVYRTSCVMLPSHCLEI